MKGLEIKILLFLYKRVIFANFEYVHQSYTLHIYKIIKILHLWFKIIII